MKSIKNIDPIYLVGGAVVLIALAINAPSNFTAMQQNQATARAIAQSNQEAELRARLASASAQRQAEVAKQRYQDGCQMTFASNAPGNFAAIQQGKPVLDGTTGAPIADGAVVCDSVGITAIIRDGVASSIAFSPDRQVIRDAMKRYQDAQYRAPGQ
jgi:hypothetical protein